MDSPLGVALIVIGALSALGVGFGLRRRLPAAVGFGLAALCCVAVGTGALLVQSGVSAAEWVIVLVATGVLGPAHLRIVLGPFGRTDRTGGPKRVPGR